jgi:cytidyltransferase-like protein
MKKKRVLVDMSFTIPHHGHIRLIKKANKLGNVIIALTSDSEIKKKKGYKPELDFNQRKEILESNKHVTKVIKSPWLINDKFIKKNKIDILVHGNDNKNKVTKAKIVLLKRTRNISSNLIRKKGYFNLSKTKTKK